MVAVVEFPRLEGQLEDGSEAGSRSEVEANPLTRFCQSHPALIRFGIPSLFLAVAAVCAIMFWPQAAIEAGGDTPPLIASLTEPPTSPGLPDEAGDFSVAGGLNAKAQPIAPVPDSRFRPDPALSTSSIENFIDETAGDVEADGAGAEPPGVAKQDEPQAAAQDELPSAADQARGVLESALASDSVEALARVVLSPGRVRAKMDAYYGGRSPALTGTSIIYETSMPLPDSEFLNHTFFVSTTEQPMRFPVAVEETADGLKLDWESFIELHDDLLGKFLANPQSDEQSFHLILERRHFFGDGVPKLGSKDCFRISTPIPGSEGYAFVEKGSPAAAACKPFAWDRLCFPIASLRWVSPPGGKPYLQITEIVQTTWRAKSSDQLAAE